MLFCDVWLLYCFVLSFFLTSVFGYRFSAWSHVWVVFVWFGLGRDEGTESTGRRRWFYFGVRLVQSSPQKVRFVAT